MKEILEALKKLSRHAAKLAKLLGAYDRLASSLVDNAYLREKKLAEISKLFSGIPDGQLKADLQAWLGPEVASLEKSKEDFKFEFGERIKQLMAEAGIAVRGQYPKLRVGLFTLAVNFEFGEAELYFGPEVEKIRSKIPLEPAAVRAAVLESRNELLPEKFDVQEFYDRLQAAYKSRLGEVGKNSGERLRLVDVLHRYVLLQQPEKFVQDPRRKHFRECPRITLSWMVYRLRRSIPAGMPLRLHVATFDATTDKSTALWVPDDEDGAGTYYSHVSF